MVMAGIFRIEGVFSNTEWGIFELPPVFLFFLREKIVSLEAGTCAVCLNMAQIESMTNVIHTKKKYGTEIFFKMTLFVITQIIFFMISFMFLFKPT